MINRNSVTSVYSLAGAAERDGLVILPYADTPLAVLNSTIGNFATGADVVEETLVSASQHSNQLGQAEHSEAIDEMVTIAARAVRNQLKFSREIVRPLVTDAFEQVNKYLDDGVQSNLRHSIKEVNLPEIYNESAVDDLVGRYAQQPQIDVPSGSKVFPELSAEELIARCKTGLSRFDTVLTSLIESSDNIVSRVYNDYFLGRSSFDSNIGSYDAEKVIAFVLARSLNQSVPDGVGVDLTTWRSVTSTFLAEFGRRVYQTLRRRDRISRQMQLIDRMPAATDPSEIRVHGEVYRKFLKEGGKPEAIIGACLRNIQAPNYKDLLEDAYGGEKAVIANERLLQGRLVTEYESNVTLGLLEYITKVINGKELPEGVDLPAHQDVKDWLKANPYRKNQPLDTYVLSCVCHTLFSRYNAYSVLSGIMSYMANDEALTQREAATLVTIDLVGEYLGAQLTTENIGK